MIKYADLVRLQENNIMWIAMDVPLLEKIF